MNEIVVSNFNYGDLAPEAATIAMDAASTIRKRVIRQFEEALPHGVFGKWLNTEFGWAERTAQNYMRAAETFGDNRNVAVLPSRLLYRLQAPSVPPELRDDVLQRAEQGERFTEADVGRLLRNAAAHRKMTLAEARISAKQRRRNRKWKVEREAQIEAAEKAAALVHECMPAVFDNLVALLEQTTSRHFVHFIQALKRQRPVVEGSAL